MPLGRCINRKGKDELRWSWVVARATCPLHERRHVEKSRRTPPARDARQDGLDCRGDGADEHRSRRAAHRRIVRQYIRLKIRGRSPAEVAPLLLLRHLDLNRRDVDRVEKTPATTRSQPRSPPLPASHPQTHAALVRGDDKRF